MDPLNTHICRLCFGDQSSLVSIFDECDTNIPELLNKHIGEVAELDVLPKYICSGCFEKVSNFHGFYRDVHAAQRDFIDNLVKAEGGLGEAEAFPLPSITDEPDMGSFAEEASEFGDGDAISVADDGEKVAEIGFEASMMEPETYDNLDECRERFFDESDIKMECAGVDEEYPDEGMEYNTEGEAAATKLTSGTVDGATVSAIIAEYFDHTCDSCPVQLKTFKHAISHYSTKHNNQSGYLKCCGLKFKKKLHVLDHVRWHLDPTVFQCKYCDRGMKTRLSLSVHQSKHKHPTNFTCEICGRNFMRHDTIKRHMETHRKDAKNVKPSGQRKQATRSRPRNRLADDDVLDLRHFLDPTNLEAHTERPISQRLRNKPESVMANDDAPELGHFLDPTTLKADPTTLEADPTTLEAEPTTLEADPTTLEADTERATIQRLIAKPESVMADDDEQDSVDPTPLPSDTSESDADNSEDGAATEKDDDTESEDDSEDDWNIEKKPNSKYVDVEEETIAAVLAEHANPHCDLCPTPLKTLDQAISHYRRAHRTKDGHLRCCSLKLNQRSVLVDHIRWHLDPSIFQCEYCGQGLKTRSALSGHLAHHRDPERYTCTVCNYYAKSLQKLDRHKKKHTRIKKAQNACRFCAKICNDGDELKQHITQVHNETVEQQLDELIKYNRETIVTDALIAQYFQLSCDQCDQQLTSFEHAHQHYLEHHHTDGYLKCCDQNYRSMYKIRQHVRYHMQPERYVCAVCSVQSNCLDAFRQHACRHRRMGVDAKRNYCFECKKQFAKKLDFLLHQRMHERSNDTQPSTSATDDQFSATCDADLRKYADMRCEVCHIELTDLQHAHDHYPEHGIEKGYLRCCDTKLSKKCDVLDHLRYHLDPAIFECPLCGQKFTRKFVLQRHFRNHEAIHDERYKCEVCHRKFATKYMLKVHMRSHERKARRTIDCAQCRRKFASDALLASHIRRIHDKTGEGVRSSICEFCAKTFASSHTLLKHVQTMHSDDAAKDQHQCNICQKWLSNQYVLKAHMERHTSEPQQCPHCDKVSPNRGALGQHIHHMHGPAAKATYTCHLCAKSFKVANALKDHVATHTGEKAFKCSFCPEAFIWRQNMYKHQKAAHPVEHTARRLEKEAAKNPSQAV